MTEIRTRCEICHATAIAQGRPESEGVTMMDVDADNIELVCQVCCTRIPVDLVISGVGDALAKSACTQMKAHIDNDERSHLACSYQAAIYVLKILRLAATITEHHYCPPDYSNDWN